MWGVITILIGIKLWTLWEIITTEANTIMLNMNLLNPIPAYLMAMFYHGIIRPGQMVVQTGASFLLNIYNYYYLHGMIVMNY
jgi:multisubunit Na+/H+ antiporter MnhG subunit